MPVGMSGAEGYATAALMLRRRALSFAETHRPVFTCRRPRLFAFRTGSDPDVAGVRKWPGDSAEQVLRLGGRVDLDERRPSVIASRLLRRSNGGSVVDPRDAERNGVI